MADLLPRNRALPNTTLQRGDTSQVLPSMRSPSSALVAPLTGLFTHKSLRDARIFRPTREASKTDDTEFFPDGHGYELVSSVRALVPQKFSVEEELIHVKRDEVKSPHVGVMWKFGRGVISSGIVLVT
ncbi:hypothetical protein TNCV_745361 [Trichonephila clavipes]|nr:hypothetical protein TNCV_745361 [Trichonephila clavipes]